MRLKTARFSCERHGADSATLTGASLRPPAAGRLARPHCPRALRRPPGPAARPPRPSHRRARWRSCHGSTTKCGRVADGSFSHLGARRASRMRKFTFRPFWKLLNYAPPPPRVGSPGPSRAPRGTSARASAARTAPPFRLPASRS